MPLPVPLTRSLKVVLTVCAHLLNIFPIISLQHYKYLTCVLSFRWNPSMYFSLQSHMPTRQILVPLILGCLSVLLDVGYQSNANQLFDDLEIILRLSQTSEFLNSCWRMTTHIAEFVILRVSRWFPAQKLSLITGTMSLSSSFTIFMFYNTINWFITIFSQYLQDSAVNDENLNLNTEFFMTRQ